MKFKQIERELIKPTNYSEVREIKDPTVDRNDMLRLYSANPEAFAFQIRVKGSLTDHGTPRFMVATCWLTLEDLEAMTAFARKEADK